MEKSLYYEILGESGPKLVFIPGITGTTRYWKNRVSHLADSKQLILIDPLGFGNSPKPRISYTVDQHVNALYSVLSSHQKFTLVGHSMGSILAVAYAARYPTMVERLVLISLPYFGNEESAVKYFRQQKRYFITNALLASIACILGRRILGGLLPRIYSNWPREIIEDVLKHNWRSFTSSLWEVIYRYDLAQDVDRIPSTIPVLCLHGDNDAVAPLEGLKHLVKRRPEWKISVLPGGDHHPIHTHPGWCLQHLENI